MMSSRFDEFAAGAFRIIPSYDPAPFLSSNFARACFCFATVFSLNLNYFLFLDRFILLLKRKISDAVRAASRQLVLPACVPFFLGFFLSENVMASLIVIVGGFFNRSSRHVLCLQLLLPISLLPFFCWSFFRRHRGSFFSCPFGYFEPLPSFPLSPWFILAISVSCA